MKPLDSNSRPVFSSEDGQLCPRCSEAVGKCQCPDFQEEIPDGLNIRIGFESKGRGGKAVSTISGLPLNIIELKALAKQLKKTCGSGGAIKAGIIEIQGDHREKIEKALAKRGFHSKRSGGS